MPLSLGHYRAVLVPTSRLIMQVMQVHDGQCWWSTRRAFHQVVNFPIEHGVGRQTDGIGKALGFQELVQIGDGERGIATKELTDVQVTVPLDHGCPRHWPIMSASHVVVAEHRAFHVTVLIETGQRVIALATEVSVVLRAFLLAIGLADRTVQIENELL